MLYPLEQEDQGEVLVLDEPTSELDPKGAEEVMSLLERLNMNSVLR